MTTARAAAPRHRIYAVLGLLTRALFLALLLIVGLVLMHGMNLHNEHASSTGAVTPAETAHGHAAGPLLQGSGLVATGRQHLVDQPNALACTDCDEQGAQAAAAGCVLALILFLLLLPRRGSVLVRRVFPSRAGPRRSWASWSVLRAPSLISLCISRT